MWSIADGGSGKQVCVECKIEPLVGGSVVRDFEVTPAFTPPRFVGLRCSPNCMIVLLQSAAVGLNQWSTEMGQAIWYGRGRKYWESASSSNDGVLCGSAHVHEADIADSLDFLSAPQAEGEPPLWPLPHATTLRALDVGAGIGRVSRDMLLNICDEVDMVEGCEKFVREAERTLDGNTARPAQRGRMRRFICADLQSFVVPDAVAQPYHLIWIQWCVGHLTDADLERLLRECTRALAPGGLLVLKDNAFESSKIDAETRSEVVDGTYLVSEQDSSVIRTLEHLVSIVRAGCHVGSACDLVATTHAKLNDPELCPVVTLAVRARRSQDGAATAESAAHAKPVMGNARDN